MQLRYSTFLLAFLIGASPVFIGIHNLDCPFYREHMKPLPVSGGYVPDAGMGGPEGGNSTTIVCPICQSSPNRDIFSGEVVPFQALELIASSVPVRIFRCPPDIADYSIFQPRAPPRFSA